MELPDWLPAYADPKFRDRIRPFSLLSTGSRSRVEQMMLEDCGVPLLFHVEGDAARKVASAFFENGWREQTDFHGGGENFTGLLYKAVSQWVEIALAALISTRYSRSFRACGWA